MPFEGLDYIDLEGCRRTLRQNYSGAERVMKNLDMFLVQSHKTRFLYYSVYVGTYIFYLSCGNNEMKLHLVKLAIASLPKSILTKIVA